MHAFLFVYGFFPLLAFGYLFTALPSWLEMRPAHPREYTVPGAAAAVCAWLLLPAFYASPALAAALILVMLASWAWMLGYFLLAIDAARDRPHVHALIAALCIAVALVGLACARLWLLNGSQAAGQAMVTIGLWGFLVPLALTVGHHMMCSVGTYLGSLQALWLSPAALALLVAGSAAHGLLEALAPPWRWLADVPLGAGVVLLASAWGLSQGSGSRLAAMLHAAFGWLGVAWLLHAAQSSLSLAGVAALGHAPTHAAAIGFLATMALAMACRVGRPVSGHRVDALMWLVFLAIQATAVARVAAELWSGTQSTLLFAAAAAWLASFAAWSWRHMPRPSRARVVGD